MGLFVEPDVHDWVQSVGIAEFTTTWIYTLAHTTGFTVMFLWVWFRRRENYAMFRNWFWVTNGIAVLGYWLYPLAPPRLTGIGLEDPTKQALELGGALSWFQPFRNEFAAMPSMHVGYSFLFGLTLFWLLRPSPWRWLAFLWPAGMLFTVMATANHWWLDGVGGAMVVLVALAVIARLAGPYPRPWQSAGPREDRDGHRVRLPGARGRAGARPQPEPRTGGARPRGDRGHQPRPLRDQGPGPGDRRGEPGRPRLPHPADGPVDAAGLQRLHRPRERGRRPQGRDGPGAARHGRGPRPGPGVAHARPVGPAHLARAGQRGDLPHVLRGRPLGLQALLRLRAQHHGPHRPPDRGVGGLRHRAAPLLRRPPLRDHPQRGRRGPVPPARERGRAAAGARRASSSWAASTRATGWTPCSRPRAS